MSLIMNPQQVKRREYLGLGTTLIGAVFVVSSIFSVFFAPLIALALAVTGSAVLATGIFVLNSIPDVLASADELLS